MTLLDGEMVVDEDAKTGTCRRRYLAYDLMVLNHNVVANRPFRVCCCSTAGRMLADCMFLRWHIAPAVSNLK